MDVIEIQEPTTELELVVVGEEEKDKISYELSVLEEQNGVLKPEHVVEYAKNESTALHHQFTWDDTVAGHQWRLQQARMLIRACVTIIRNDEKEIETRAWVNVVTASGRGYASVVKVLSEDDLRKQMVDNAYRELSTFRKKYSNLNELTKVFDAIDDLRR